MGGRGARRGRAIPKQWVSSPNGYGSVGTIGASSGIVTAVLAGADGVAASFNPPIIQRFTVLRIRGEVIWAPLTGATGDVYVLGAGIMLTKIADTGQANYDPTSQPDAGSPWLWLRHLTVCIGSTNNATLGGMADQWSFDIDVKSKRVVKENERLVIFTKVLSVTGGGLGTFSQIDYLRTLISKVA